MAEQSSEFTGWAIVEVMGHRKLAGYVTTNAFGSAVMFRVHAPAIPPVQQVLEKQQFVPDHGYLPAGTKLQVARDEFEQWVGVSSVYAMTPCSEEQAIASLGQKITVLEIGKEPESLPAASDCVASDYPPLKPENADFPEENW